MTLFFFLSPFVTFTARNVVAYVTQRAFNHARADSDEAMHPAT